MTPSAQTHATGTLNITAQGTLLTDGQLAAGQSAILRAGSNLETRGKLTARAGLTLAAAGMLVNHGGQMHWRHQELLWLRQHGMRAEREVRLARRRAAHRGKQCVERRPGFGPRSRSAQLDETHYGMRDAAAICASSSCTRAFIVPSAR